MLEMPGRRMPEAAVAQAPESAMAESTAMEPATETTSMKSAAKSTTAVGWPRKRKPAGRHQKYSRKPGAPGCAKRCVVHVRAPVSRVGAPPVGNDWRWPLVPQPRVREPSGADDRSGIAARSA